MYVVTVEFIVQPTPASDFRTRVRKRVADSLRNEVDCHAFDVCRDPQRLVRLFLYEVYENEVSFYDDLESAHSPRVAPLNLSEMIF